MSFRRRSVIIYAILLAVAGAAVVVFIIKNGKTEFDKIEAAVPGWLSKTGCAKIEIIRPSRDTSFVKWVGPNATTATIDCEYVSGFLDYARFGSMSALSKALHSRPHKERLCVTGRTVLEDA